MTIHLSCGHVAEDGCFGVPVEFQDEQCVAGEGFVPCTVEAVYCHKCAMDLAAAEERAKIVAWLRDSKSVMKIMEPWHSRKKDGTLTNKTRENIGVAYIAMKDAADAIEAKEHLK